LLLWGFFDPVRVSRFSMPSSKPRFFYGWYIVGVGFLSHLACAFHMSSTLSVFLKPLTEDLAVSRGLFSLLRSGEILIGAAMAPLVGPLVDRHGGRWLMAGGALIVGAGFMLLSQVGSFWQFHALRWTFVTIGGVFMCHMVVSVTISRWFVRRRGRAIAMASLGQGLSKVCIPPVTALLFVWLGWRGTWSVFGVITLVLIITPALIFMRRSPEDIGLQPDGDEPGEKNTAASESHSAELASSISSDEVVWHWREVIRTDTFWIVCFIYGMVNVGIAGLNLHVFAYVTDIGFSAAVGATVLSIIAATQLGSTLIWGFLGERMDIRHSSLLIVQAFGLGLVIATSEASFLYMGFLLYGIGLGGGWVLQELIWANYFGRLSLGAVRGAGILVTHAFGAAGAPFFGFIHDATGSYTSSFISFVCALVLSALLSLIVRPPRKRSPAV
jgi:OFA family oxalate/formate antiporter-like MFS transporter